RDDIGLGEISRCAEAARKLVEEFQVDVDLAVARAIEWTAGRTGETAGRLDLARKDHHLRLLVLRARCLEYRIPDILGLGQHDARELQRLVIGRGLLRARACSRTAIEDFHRVDADRPQTYE